MRQPFMRGVSPSPAEEAGAPYAAAAAARGSAAGRECAVR